MCDARRKRIWAGNLKGDDSDTYRCYKNKKREFRKQKRKVLKIWYEQKEAELLNSAEVYIQDFYKTVKKQPGKYSEDKPLKYKGKIAINPQEKCDILANYYSELLSPEDSDIYDAESDNEIENKTLLITRITYPKRILRIRVNMKK